MSAEPTVLRNTALWVENSTRFGNTLVTYLTWQIPIEPKRHLCLHGCKRTRADKLFWVSAISWAGCENWAIYLGTCRVDATLPSLQTTRGFLCEICLFVVSFSTCIGWGEAHKKKGKNLQNTPKSSDSFVSRRAESNEPQNGLFRIGKKKVAYFYGKVRWNFFIFFWPYIYRNKYIEKNI